jgi:transcriptional regulator with XRE-family HTH domain|tara:strand:+ start:1728 stop:1925 length:198 start_codon:yes stop_codon:yes gene_type:complete
MGKKMNWSVKAKLAEKEMRQGDLAKELGVSESYISRLIRGTVADGKDIKRRVARALETEVGEIFK